MLARYLALDRFPGSPSLGYPAESDNPVIRSKTCVFVLAPLISLFVVSGVGQEPMRVNVRLVNVAFSARDSRGALIENLTKDDVEVFEDAVPQKISFFAHGVDVPLTNQPGATQLRS